MVSSTLGGYSTTWVVPGCSSPCSMTSQSVKSGSVTAGFEATASSIAVTVSATVESKPWTRPGCDWAIGLVVPMVG